MGKAKRFNTYDESISSSRKQTQLYGEGRQKLSIGSSFRTMPQSPPNGEGGGTTSSGTGDGNCLEYHQTKIRPIGRIFVE